MSVSWKFEIFGKDIPRHAFQRMVKNFEALPESSAISFDPLDAVRAARNPFERKREMRALQQKEDI